MEDELHLAPLSAVVQLRPQLHHLDAVDDNAKGKPTPRSKKDADDDASGRPGEPEVRAIDMKVKSAESENVNVTGNNELLKRMQDEKWEKYTWIDENVRFPCNLDLPLPTVELLTHYNRCRTKNLGTNMKNICSTSLYRNPHNWLRPLMRKIILTK